MLQTPTGRILAPRCTRKPRPNLPHPPPQPPLNIAEGNGKATDGDRRHYFEIARGSALECVAVQDVLQICGALSADENANRKALPDRIVAMLTRLGQRGYAVNEDQAQYTVGGDPDTDPDAEGNQEQTDRQPSAPGDA